MNIKYVNIPNKWGVEKKIPVESLTEKQCNIQLRSCEKQFELIDNQIKELVSNNISLNKVKTVEAKQQQESNVLKIKELERKLKFFEAVHFCVYNAYINNYKSEEIMCFENNLQTT